MDREDLARVDLPPMLSGDAVTITERLLLDGDSGALIEHEVLAVELDPAPQPGVTAELPLLRCSKCARGLHGILEHSEGACHECLGIPRD